MIEMRPKGIMEDDLENIVGRIVMLDGGAIFTTFVKPYVVQEVSKKTLTCFPLKRFLPTGTAQQVYLDELVTDDGYFTVQFKAARLICDNASEVNLIRSMNDQIEDDYNAVIKTAYARFENLAADVSETHDNAEAPRI